MRRDPFSLSISFAPLCTALSLATGCGSSGSGALLTAKPSSDAGGGASGDSGGSLLLTDDSGVATVAPDAACATDHAGATLGASYLVFVMDRSDSMSKDSKWTSCSAALTDFFSDPLTVGIESALTWLPEVTPGTHSTAAMPSFLCTASSYATADVPLTPLPSPAFGITIAAQSLEDGTPTLAALEGAGTQAQAIAAAHAGAKVVVVLATDGLPAGCTGDSVAAVAAAAASLAQQGILTYIIGVGSATGNLDTIASGGGTGTAFVVPTGNPTATAQSFLSAIKSVAGSIVSCDFAIPPPPNGEQIDYASVNVLYTSGTGVATTLPYSGGCANPDGWQYDDPTTPTKIELCSQACTTAQGDSQASLEIVFGCATEGGPIK